jgi:YD repeat-containing protein
LGNKTANAYDLAGRLTSRTDADNNVTTYGYDADGETTSTTDADGRTRSFSYDSGGRQTAENWLNSQGQSVYTISYTYDSDGHLTAVSDPDASYAYTYNANGQALTWNDSHTFPPARCIPRGNHGW